MGPHNLQIRIVSGQASRCFSCDMPFATQEVQGITFPLTDLAQTMNPIGPRHALRQILSQEIRSQLHAGTITVYQICGL
jgi:hypothetical protein